MDDSAASLVQNSSAPGGEPDVASAYQALSVDLVDASQRLIKLLLAVDCFPHGKRAGGVQQGA